MAKVWKAVEEQGLANNTIFIFSSDNGPGRNTITYEGRQCD
jgi:arylsulfatase A-like enzyme